MRNVAGSSSGNAPRHGPVDIGRDHDSPRPRCADALLALFAGCSEPHSVMVKRPQDTNLDAAVTAMWSHEIHSVAQDGDWILTRSYYMVADGIASTTAGEDLSHASIYDAQKDTSSKRSVMAFARFRCRSSSSATTTSSSCARAA